MRPLLILTDANNRKPTYSQSARFRRTRARYATRLMLFLAMFNLAFISGCGVTVTARDQSPTPVISLSSEPGLSQFGNPVAFTIAVSNTVSTPNGSVTLLADGKAVFPPQSLNGGTLTISSSALSVGAHVMTASYIGEGDNEGSSTTQSYTQTVQKATPSISINGPTYPVTVENSLTLTATLVTVSRQVAPTGSVQFSDNGAYLGTSPIAESGIATLTTSTLKAGPHTLGASYIGDGNYNSASKSYVQQIQKVTPSMSISGPGSQSTAGKSILFTAALDGFSGPIVPSGNVQFLDNGKVLGTGTLSGSGRAVFSASHLTTGIDTISAYYSGDSNFNNASAATTESIQPAPKNLPGQDQDYPTYGYAATVGANTIASLPVFDAKDYGVSASANTGVCTGSAGASTLTCTLTINDFKVGQGIWLAGAGRASMDAAITTQPIVTKNGTGTGPHTFCYIVYSADPANGISQPSPGTCIGNEPLLSFAGVQNLLTTTTSNTGTAPAFLWYASMDDGPYQLAAVQMQVSNATDMGQRVGSHNGWPNNFSSPTTLAKPEDLIATVTAITGNQLTISVPVVTSVAEALLQHDDTAAVQNTINAALASGGGTVHLPKGTINIRRPSFSDGFANFKTYTTDITRSPWWSGSTYLYLPTTSSGHINLQGEGVETHIILPPDHNQFSYFFSVGDFGRGYGIAGLIKMDDVPLGGTRLTIRSNASGQALAAGQDVWLYTGSENPGGTPCVDDTTANTPGESMCHFSELNTIASVHGDVITLAYPTSKRYYDDGVNSFGLVLMPTTPHIIGFQHFSLDSSSMFTGCGMSYGMLINDVHILQSASDGPLGCGFRRDVTVENSSWSTGAGESSWSGVDEYDEDTNFAFLNNQITGYSAPGAEGPASMSGEFLSEGTSHFLYDHNHFINQSIITNETAGDVVVNNTFDDGVLAIGTAFGTNAANYDFYQRLPFASFGGQGILQVQSNTFNISSSYIPPWILRTGHFDSAQVLSNVINDASTRWMEVAKAYSGVVSNNTINVTGIASYAITLVGDEASSVPDSSFQAEQNVIGGDPAVAVFVPDPGFSATQPVCVSDNVVPTGVKPLVVVNANSVNMSCTTSAAAQISSSRNTF